MITLMDVMGFISLPEEVKEILLQLEKNSDFEAALSADKMEEYTEKMTEKDNWEQAQKAVKSAVTPDEKGFKMLYVMLLAACRSYEKYRQCGIADAVFTATMKCFTRFVGEYRQIYGVVLQIR